jgi:vitamin B12/bleomycin/antimicrobial peptide transport system ATP-binding/permease protein
VLRSPGRGSGLKKGPRIESNAQSSVPGAETLRTPVFETAQGTLMSQVRAFIGVFGVKPARRRLIILIGSILAIILITVLGQLRLNSWYKDFYNAIERRNLAAFGIQLLVFGAIVGFLLTLNVAQTWLNQMIKLRAREQLTRDLVGEWLVPKRDFLLVGAGPISRNPDQRIHEDARHLTDLTADLGIGLIQALLLLISFVGVLWVLSEGVTFTIGGRTFGVPGYMVWCALTYAAIGSLLSWGVGRPLVALNVEHYAREADLRFALVRTNENVDGIALYGGEANERKRLNAEIDQLLAILRRIVGAITRLTWVTAGYGWLAIVIPILAASPGFFEGHLSFGDLMMVTGAFNQVQGSLRWFVDNFGALADWRATLRRVIGFRQVLRGLTRSGSSANRIVLRQSDSNKLVLDNLVVTLADGQVALHPGHIEVSAGQRVLILGRAGAGKSRAFRAIAGLWLWGSGTISIPHSARMFFLPQRPYVPPGTLRSTLCYPATPPSKDDVVLGAALKRVGLDNLIQSLDKVARWDKDLALDAQQRLSFARLLLTKPEFILLDDAFEVLDEEHRKLVGSIFKQELAHSAIVSFSRNSVAIDGYDLVVRLERLTQPGMETLPEPAGEPDAETSLPGPVAIAASAS